MSIEQANEKDLENMFDGDTMLTKDQLKVLEEQIGLEPVKVGRKRRSNDYNFELWDPKKPIKYFIGESTFLTIVFRIELFAFFAKQAGDAFSRRCVLSR